VSAELYTKLIRLIAFKTGQAAAVTAFFAAGEPQRSPFARER
jgi:hypothetical protein